MAKQHAENPNYSPKTETYLDRITAVYLQQRSVDDLSDEEKAIKAEIDTAHSLLLKYLSTELAVKKLKGRFGISQATAYRRCSDAHKLFGNVVNSSKEGVRNLLYEAAARTWRLALKKKDVKGMNAAIKNMAMIKGIDKEDSNALTPDLLANKSFMLQLVVSGIEQSFDLNSIDTIDPGTYAQVVDAVEQSDLSLDQMRGLLLEAAEDEGEEDEDAH